MKHTEEDGEVVKDVRSGLAGCIVSELSRQLLVAKFNEIGRRTMQSRDQTHKN